MSSLQGSPSQSVPWKLGRYEVVGHLATGGMAEIVLGRIIGPSGFQRAVVIKRILPHLARDPEFVGMFLDEARIVAGIRHPNVVQVQELGHEDGQLFLAMEYLEGESVAGLARRLRVRGKQLPYELAAYIVAEAAGGLHAAHELTDSAGRPQNVVHRDVSPQNVFIGYDGVVKVLDFGIAVAADRTTRTETGMFKGKFEYSSPEQCRAKPLDRRSDVFALGILLYEISTGTRLFKRSGQLDTLRAICEQPIIPPTTIVEGYPPPLAKVVMHALERKKEARYASAKELRQDLLATIRVLSDEVSPSEQLGTLMQKLFPERIQEKAEMLRCVQGDAKGEIAIPSVETDASVEIPVAFGEGSSPPPSMSDFPDAPLTPIEETPSLLTPADQLSSPGTTGSTRSVAQPVELNQVVPPRVPFGLIALLLVFVAMAGIGLLLMFLWSRAGTTGSTAAASSTDPSALSASSTVAVDLPGTPSTPAVIVSTASPPTQTQSPATATPDIVVHVETIPPHARVLIAGKDRGASPIDLKIPRGTKELEIEIRHDGYRPIKERVVPDADQKLKLTLVSTKDPPRPITTSSGVPYHRFD